MHNTLRRARASRGGNHKGIAGFDLSALESMLGAFRINQESRGEGGEERLSRCNREARVEGHNGVIALPGLREGLHKALSGLGDRHQFLHRG
ncbi:unannotated protein [freshwater metagenome]|uniref:Unannotated protein n=1 Tax=freshwater metagenome TaxID=449393 RepID=A0A6J7NQS5_9ZZZZ